MLEQYNWLHGFYCNISSLSTENFHTVIQNELEGKRQPLWLFDDRLNCVESTEDQRRIHESGKTGKRQGTKRRRKKGMSLLVAMPAAMGGSRYGSNSKIWEWGRICERETTRAGDAAGRVCGVFRGLHRACARIRLRCRPVRYCGRQR